MLHSGRREPNRLAPGRAHQRTALAAEELHHFAHPDHPTRRLAGTDISSPAVVQSPSHSLRDALLVYGQQQGYARAWRAIPQRRIDTTADAGMVRKYGTHSPQAAQSRLTRHLE